MIKVEHKSAVCDKMGEFQKLWKKLSNEWYDNLGFNPEKD